MSSYLTTGSNGSLGAEWQIQNARRNQMGRYFGMSGSSGTDNMDFQAYLTLNGVDQAAVLDQIEVSILGIDNVADGKLLSWEHCASGNESSDDKIFQSSGHGYYTNIDFDNGTYEVLDEQTISESLGMDWSGGKPYDVLEIVSNQINFHDFVFAGTSDGVQDKLSVNLSELNDARWGNAHYNFTEVNINLADAKETSDYESFKAHSSLDLMLSEADRWLTNGMKAELSKLKPGSTEYNQKLRDFAYQVYDNEGYLSGNTIASPSQKDLSNVQIADGKNFTAVRGADGQALVGIKDADYISVNNLGSVTGDAVLSLGKTDGRSNETVIQVGQIEGDGELRVDVASTTENLEFYGENLEADFNNRFAKTYNVQWNASDSLLDATKGGSSITIQTGAKAENNTINLGTAYSKTDIGGQQFDNLVVDNGKNNTVTSTSNSGNYFETTASSQNATFIGGDRNNWFDIAGKHGVAVGGNSRDIFITNTTANANMLSGMDGDDALADSGKNTFFAGGKGVDSVAFNGTNGVAQLGDGEDYSVSITRGAANNQAWAGTEYERDADNLAPGQKAYYNYQQNLETFMAKNNISFDNIQERLASTSRVDEILKSIKQSK